MGSHRAQIAINIDFISPLQHALSLSRHSRRTKRNGSLPYDLTDYSRAMVGALQHTSRCPIAGIACTLRNREARIEARGKL